MRTAEQRQLANPAPQSALEFERLVGLLHGKCSCLRMPRSSMVASGLECLAIAVLFPSYRPICPVQCLVALLVLTSFCQQSCIRAQVLD